MARTTKPLLALCALLGACGPLVDLGGQSGPPARIYEVSAAGQASIASLETPAIILVEEPFASSVLDSDRIAVTLSGGEIQFLSGARWSDRPTRMARRVLQDTLGSVDGLTALGRGGLDIPSEYRLKVQLRDFHVDNRSGTARTAVSVQAWLVETGGDLVATQSFSAASDLPIVDSANAVSGVQSDLSDVARALTQWVADTLESQSKDT
ncbi:MAG: ABC-type transport auxiliary lipoprotein family protein [Pseudomonadota bacterium]